MKNILLLACALMVAGTSFGQSKSAVKVTPVTILKGQLAMVHYEYNAWGNATVSLGVAPVISGPILGSLAFPAEDGAGGIAIDPEIRWYGKDDGAMNGFFFGLYNSNRISNWTSDWSQGDFLDLTEEGLDPADDSYEVSATKSIFGLQLGTHKPLGDHFSVDFYSGLGLSLANTNAVGNNTGKSYDIPSGGINLRLNIAFGYQF